MWILILVLSLLFLSGNPERRPAYTGSDHGVRQYEVQQGTGVGH